MKHGIRMKLFAIAAMAATAFAQPTNNTSQASVTGKLTEQVRHELAMMPYYSVFDYVAFKLDGRTVTLLGEVNRPTLRDEAERRVKTLEGVEKVENQIRVLPLSPFDDRIRMATLRAIYNHPVLSRYSLGSQPAIHLLVDNGKLTLKGKVMNEMDRNIAGIVANGVFGAFEVRNELVVN